MSEEPKPKARFVSKPEFAWRKSEYFVLRAISEICLGCGVVGLAWGVMGVCFLITVPLSLFWLGIASLLAVMSYLVLYFGTTVKRRVETAEKVVPLTRQTASQIPPEESLVRASSEPSQPQEKVLLRAAGSGQETPAEELLRASLSSCKEPEL